VANDGRQFSCTVRSPWLEKYKVGVTESWNLPQAAEDIVLDFMERITVEAITPGMLLAELRGQGRELFDSSPKNFQQAFWDLIDSGHEIKRIALVTQEPYIPWELMIPYRWSNGKRQQRGALGTEFSVRPVANAVRDFSPPEDPAGRQLCDLPGLCSATFLRTG